MQKKVFCAWPYRTAPTAGEAIPIKNDILAVYTRYYSNLPPFQQAGTAEYILCRLGGQLRAVVRAQRADEGRMRVAQCGLDGLEEAAARSLVQFLYENAVTVENACDIVQDVCAAVGAGGKTQETGADVGS